MAGSRHENVRPDWFHFMPIYKAAAGSKSRIIKKKKASFVWLPLKKSSTMRSGHHEFYPARPPPVGRTRKRYLHILSTGAALGKWGLVWLLEFFLMKMNMLSPFSTLPSSSFVTYFCSI
jgi:hypothetical protein